MGPTGKRELRAAQVEALRNGLELSRKERNAVYITDPLLAFSLSWAAENGDFRLFEDLKGDFPDLLKARCDERTVLGSVRSRFRFKLTGNSGACLTIYLATLAFLIRSWRNEQPKSGVYGSLAAHWCDRHPELLERIQAAMCSRPRYIRADQADWELYDYRPGGPANSSENKNLAIISSERFIGQRTWSEAAQTAAYSLFGDFLAGKSEQIAFCQKCGKPFERKKRTLFCSAKCGHRSSSMASRHNRRAKERLEGMAEAAKFLNKCLRKPPRAADSDWRSDTEKAFGLITRDERKSRLMGGFIKVSETPPGSPEREKLLGSLLSSSTVRLKKRTNVQQQLDGFLQDIKKANQRSKGCDVSTAHCEN